MKAIKNILAISAVALTMSCETHYRMVTTLSRDGKAHRTVYAFGDTAFMAGNISNNPFLFHLSSDWEITHLDTVVKHDFFGRKSKLNVKISKHANSIEQYSQEIQSDDDKLSFAAPEELLSKKFRWFYTDYSFKTTYKKLKYEVPVPIDNYLSREEQMLWTQGDMNNYKFLNAFEMNDYLNEIGDKFMEWYSRNCFEISLVCIKKLTTKYDLDIDRENIYKEIQRAKIEAFDINPEKVCTILDLFYKTKYFSELNEINKKTLENEFETAISVVNSIGNVICYELVHCGEITRTNAHIINSDTLIWKVDGIRLLFDNYILTAEYRIVNSWAFIFSGFILIIAVGSLCWRKFRNKISKPRKKIVSLQK